MFATYITTADFDRILTSQHPARKYTTRIYNIFDACASGKEEDVIHLDLSKAFDKVPHFLLLQKHQLLGISGTLLKWFENYLTDRLQRVVLNGVSSNWLPVTSGVALFADDTKLYRAIDSVSSNHQLQEAKIWTV